MSDTSTEAKKLKRSQKAAATLERLASDEKLPPEKRRLALALLRSQRAAVRLRVKALAWAQRRGG